MNLLTKIKVHKLILLTLDEKKKEKKMNLDDE